MTTQTEAPGRNQDQGISSHLLDVRDLRTTFRVGEKRAEIAAVDGVSFHVDPGETLAIVGESGSGKSVTSLSVMRLLPAQAGRIAAGSVRFRGRELTDLPEHQMRALRGNEISMIFQEPMTSLNPVHTIGHQIAEVVALHRNASKKAAHERAVEMLEMVGIPEPRRRAENFPHQMSGGMRQRAMIAMALACEPSLLIADEPTTALDVTIQAQILELMQSLQREMGMAIIFITHDLGVVAEIADRVCVMYAGEVVESGSVTDIFRQPRMPYTRALLKSVPRIGSSIAKQKLHTIPGHVPPLSRLPSGCRFRTRCAYAVEQCGLEAPSLQRLSAGHHARCLRVDDIVQIERGVS